MKLYLLTVFLLFNCILAMAQAPAGKGATSAASPSATPATSTSNSSQVIVFNYKTKLITSSVSAIPFDKRFYFEIDSIPTNNIMNISVYAVKYRDGKAFITDSVKKGRQQCVIRSSFELVSPDTVIGNNVITLHFPALKPEEDFDILITKQMSPPNLKKAYDLNKVLDQSSIRNLSDTCCLEAIKLRDGKFALLKDQFDDLKKTVDNFQYTNPQPTSFVVASGPYENKVVRCVNDYKTYFYDPVKKNYANLLATTASNDGFSLPAFFDQADVKTITNKVAKDATIHNRLYILEKILIDNQKFPKYEIFKKIALGLLTVDYTLPITASDPYDFNARIKNLTSTYKFADSLRAGVLALRAAKPDSNVIVAEKTDSMFYAIVKNKAYVTTNNQVITNYTTSISQEGLWIIGQNTVAQDFTTLGTKIYYRCRFNEYLGL